MDQIQINGLRVMARHGYTKEEKIMEQEFELDLKLYCSLTKAIETDRVEDTVDCVQVIQIATTSIKEESFQLIEKVAQKVIDAIFKHFKIVCGIELTLKKTQSGILADFDSVGVHLIRARAEMQ